MAKFEWIYDPSGRLKPDYDTPVMETENFVALPSLGSLVKGWLVIVPRRRMPNLSMLQGAERRDLERLIQRLVPKLQVLNDNLYLFEHGGASDSLLNCGVDQAHLHITPLNFNLFELATSEPDVNWHLIPSSRGLIPAEPAEEYLAVQDLATGQAAYGLPASPQSQWFRRLIARQLNVDTWDYKKYPSTQTMLRTLSIFGRDNA